MNPESAPQQSPEYRPPEPGQYEQSPSKNYESAPEQSHEREQAMRQVDRKSGPPLPPPIAALPQAPVALPVVQQATDDNAGPTVANDDDLIEKEWVDKAKKIIADTQNDPYKREQEVSKLQVEYLRKRYGKELGSSE